MNVVEDMPRDVSAIGQVNEPPKQTGRFGMVELCECRNCGRKHKFGQHELCSEFGKICNKCRNLIYFAVNCQT